MDSRENLFRRITDTMALPGEPMPGISVIELWGSCRILVENHRGVLHYSREEIRILTNYGLVFLQGENLELSVMTRERLIITGSILGLRICKEERPGEK